MFSRKDREGPLHARAYMGFDIYQSIHDTFFCEAVEKHPLMD